MLRGACRRFCAPRSGVGGGWLSAAAQSSRRSPPPPPPPPVGGGWALSAAAQSSRRPPSPAVDRATRLGFSTSSASTDSSPAAARHTPREGASSDSSAAAAGHLTRILFGPKVPETLVGHLKRVKVILTLVGLLVTFFLCDTAFLAWRLSHPLLPNFFLPEPHVEMSKAEAELLDIMNRSPQFVVVYGIPGCGKTTTILSAAKRRGKAVLYYSVGTGESLKDLEEKIQEEYGAVFPSLHGLVRRRSGATVWDRLTVAGEVWRKWLCPLKDASSSLVIILDNANRLEERDLYRIANIGKCATDERSFSVWLVSSEEQGLGMLERQSDPLTRARGHTLPSIPERELVRFVEKALGSHGKFTTDLAEGYVYLVGSSLAQLWQLVKSTETRSVEFDVLPHLRRCPPPEVTQDKDFFKKVLDGGEKGIYLKLEEVPSTVDWSCLQPEKGVVKIRNRRCRDLISFRVAEAEVAAAEDKVAAAEDRVTAVEDRVTAAAGEGQSERLLVRLKRAESELEDAGEVLKKALKERQDAHEVLEKAFEERDKAAKVLSKNMEFVFDTLSTYYKNTQTGGASS